MGFESTDTSIVQAVSITADVYPGQLQSLAQGKGNSCTNQVAIFTGSADVDIHILKACGREGQEQ
jgi:hypothetical protein